MFHFDNSYNYPVKVIQDEPNFCMIPEKIIKNNCLSAQEDMKNTQYNAIPVINSVINPPLTFDSSYIAQKLKQHTSKHQSKSIRSDLKRKHSVSSAERRAEHNAIERARRECLNSKFQRLADALPNLRNHRRPSKGQIVENALDWVKQNMTMENRYQYQIMQLQNENKRLINQISSTQEKDNINTSVDNYPLYIPVDYTNSHCHPLQQQVPIPFDGYSSVPVSPVSSNSSNFATGNMTGENLPMTKNQVNSTINTYDLPLSAATDEDDSDIKPSNEYFNNFNDANYCFYEYQNIKSPIYSKSHSDQ